MKIARSGRPGGHQIRPFSNRFRCPGIYRRETESGPRQASDAVEGSTARRRCRNTRVLGGSGRNAPSKAAFGAEMPLVLGAWGRLWGTFLACGEAYAASQRSQKRAQFLVPPRTKRERVFAPSRNAAVLAAKTAAQMPVR